MAISFLPISFQDSNTACDGLATGFGVAAVLASCANAGIAARTAATSRAPHLLILFIVSLLILDLPLSKPPGPTRAGVRRLTLSDGPRGEAFRSWAAKELAIWPGSSYARGLPASGETPGAGMLNLYLGS